MINFRVRSLKINSNTIEFEIVYDRPFGRPCSKESKVTLKISKGELNDRKNA